MQRPAIFKPYGADEYVKTGAAYTFSCPSEQEFHVPAGTTPPATIQYSCQTDGTFLNPVNNVAYSNPPVCVPVSLGRMGSMENLSERLWIGYWTCTSAKSTERWFQTQQCTRPSATSPVEISYDPSKCKYAPPGAEKGCVLTASCANGSYPTDIRNLNQSVFPYECTTGVLGPGWRNSSNLQQTFDLQCTPGCQNLSAISSSQDSNTQRMDLTSAFGINCSFGKIISTEFSNFD